jgi:hypothetical protein
LPGEAGENSWDFFAGLSREPEIGGKKKNIKTKRPRNLLWLYVAIAGK